MVISVLRQNTISHVMQISRSRSEFEGKDTNRVVLLLNRIQCKGNGKLS